MDAMLSYLINFLKTCSGKKYTMDNGITFTLLSCGIVSLDINGEIRYSDGTIYPLYDFAEDKKKSFRVCIKCGKPFSEGMTDLDCIYLCEPCFVPYMNDTYGVNDWKAVDDDGCDGCYMVRAIACWQGTGIFFTTWN